MGSKDVNTYKKYINKALDSFFLSLFLFGEYKKKKKHGKLDFLILEERQRQRLELTTSQERWPLEILETGELE